MSPGLVRLRQRQRHAVLQLIAKAMRAARLIERRACPDATCAAPDTAASRLASDPSRGRGLDLDGAEHVLATGSSPRRGRRRGRPCDNARSTRVRLRRTRTAPRTTRLRRSHPRPAQSRAATPRMDRGPRRLRQTAARCRSARRAAVRPLRPRNSVRSAVHEVCRPPRSANATRPANPMLHGIARQHRAGSGVDFRHDEGSRMRRAMCRSTHSIHAVTDRRRGIPDRLRNVSLEIPAGRRAARIAASRARCHSPSCSKRL